MPFTRMKWNADILVQYLNSDENRLAFYYQLLPVLNTGFKKFTDVHKLDKM